jgi:DNA-directed RNA polymerase subunit RPC12/RpoP
MQRRLVVSTECPTCAAPLDFREGSNAVHCDYCRSNLLVTGRKQILTYYVDPVIEPREAARSAWHACRDKGVNARATKWERYFLPYYRFVGHDLRWEQGEGPPHRTQEENRKLRRALALIDPEYAEILTRPALHDADTDRGRSLLRDRYVDKNFIACHLPAVALHSLGVKLAVLRLRLFRRDVLEGLGRSVAVDLTPDAALSQGMQTVSLSASILHRKVLGRLLSVVYYPFCVIEQHGRETPFLSIVDGVSGSIVALEAPIEARERLERSRSGDLPSVGFRPLACPNCGWDLPVNPDQVVFFCTSCEQAWEIEGTELRRVAYEVADVPSLRTAEHGGSLTYLPFWVLANGHDGNHPPDLFIPAFRYQRLKVLADLARDMSRRERSYAPAGRQQVPLHGCYYDRDDALGLAEVAYPGLSSSPEQALKKLEDEPLSFSSAILTWLPFEPEGQWLRDPFSRRAINPALLL